MIKRKFKCGSCGKEFVIDIFESDEEALDVMRKNPEIRRVPVRCPECNNVV